MRKIPLYKDCFAFEFNEVKPYLTYVYVIIRGSQAFMIDTFCGIDYIKDILALFPDKEWIAINTHAHFDHLWGNEGFDTIYAHPLCQPSKEDYALYHPYFKGKNPFVKPNHFVDHYIFEEANLEIVYTPGHSIDGISIYDHKHHCIFVGDNLERPIVQIDKTLLQEYQEILAYYSKHANVFHAGHTLHLNQDDVKNTIDYLQKIENHETIIFEDPVTQKIHEQNVKGE